MQAPSQDRENTAACRNNNPAWLVCVQNGCVSHPFMCSGQNCQCQVPHRTHLQQKLTGFVAKLSELPGKVVSDLKHRQELVSKLIGFMEYEVVKCRHWHSMIVEEITLRKLSYASHCTQLLSNHANLNSSLSGHMLALLLEQQDSGSFHVNLPQVQNTSQLLKRDFTNIIVNISAMWQLSTKSETSTINDSHNHWKQQGEVPEDTYEWSISHGFPPYRDYLNQDSLLEERFSQMYGSPQSSYIDFTKPHNPPQYIPFEDHTMESKRRRQIDKNIEGLSSLIVDASVQYLDESIENPSPAPNDAPEQPNHYSFQKLGTNVHYEKTFIPESQNPDFPEGEPTSLIFIDCQQEDEQLVTSRLKRASNILELVIQNCPFGDAICLQIGHLDRLNVLHIDNCNLTDAGLESVCLLPQLSEFSAYHNNLITDKGFKAVLMKLPALTTLDMPLPHISKLDVRSMQIKDRGAQFIAKNLKELTQLNIRDNGLTEIGAVAIAQRLTLLTWLRIDRNKIDSKGGDAIADNLKGLAWLYIDGNLPAVSLKRLWRCLSKTVISLC